MEGDILGDRGLRYAFGLVFIEELHAAGIVGIEEALQTMLEPIPATES